MVGTSELILFAIQAGIRLAQAARKAYAEDAAMRGIVPPFPVIINNPAGDAWNHALFVSDTESTRYDREFKPHVDNWDAADDAVSTTARRAVVMLYLQDLGDGRVEAPPASHELVAGVTAIKQWDDRERPYAHPLQRVAGAIVEIAVDYFIDVPGALNENSKHGKLVKTFLTSLESINFQETHLDQIVVEIFAAAAKTLSEYPAAFGDDERTVAVIRSAMTGMTVEINGKLSDILKDHPQGDPTAETKVLHVGQVMIRSLLRNSGQALLEAPGVIDIGDEGRNKLIHDLSGALLDQLLDDTGPVGEYTIGEALRRPLSEQGIDRLVKNAIKIVSEYPDLTGITNEPVRDWMSHIFKDLYEGYRDRSIFHEDLLPHVAFLVMDHGVRDLPILLNMKNGHRALMVTASRSLIEHLVIKGAGNLPQLRFDLTLEDGKAVFEQTLTALAQNPHWLSGDPERQQLLAALSGIAVDILGEADRNLLKAVIRHQALPIVIAAVLRSGLDSRLSPEKVQLVAQFTSRLFAAIAVQGQAGLEQIFLNGFLTDLLSALNTDELFVAVLGDDQKTVLLISALTGIINQARNGKIDTIAVMRDVLIVALTPESA